MIKLFIFLITFCTILLLSTRASFAEIVITLDRSDVLLSDVIDVHPMREAQLSRIQDLTLFRLNPGQEIKLTTDELMKRIVKRVPALEGRLELLDTQPRRFRQVKKREFEISDCLQLIKPVLAGEPILRSHVNRSPVCFSKASSMLEYDSQAGTFVSKTNIDAGTALPIENKSIFPIASRGQELQFLFRAGTVSVTRPVTLVDSVYEAGWTHARTSGGDIIRVHVSDGRGGSL